MNEFDTAIIEAMCAAHWNAAKTISWETFMQRQPGSRQYWHDAMRAALAAMRQAERDALNPTQKAVEDRMRPTASGTPTPLCNPLVPPPADPPGR